MIDLGLVRKVFMAAEFSRECACAGGFLGERWRLWSGPSLRGAGTGDPQGLKPTAGSRVLRGAEAPLFHAALKDRSFTR